MNQSKTILTQLNNMEQLEKEIVNHPTHNIARLTTARKLHTCKESGQPIYIGTQYYCVYFGSPKTDGNPDRVLPEFLGQYFSKQHHYPEAC